MAPDFGAIFRPQKLSQKDEHPLLALIFLVAFLWPENGPEIRGRLTRQVLNVAVIKSTSCRCECQRFYPGPVRLVDLCRWMPVKHLPWEGVYPGMKSKNISVSQTTMSHVKDLLEGSSNIDTSCFHQWSVCSNENRYIHAQIGCICSAKVL